MSRYPDYLFIPTENPVVYGSAKTSRRKNPIRETYLDPLYSARLFVGLTEGEGKKAKKHDAKKVREIVRAIRITQTGDPGSSFVTQRGLYLSQKTGNIVDEASLQVIILNFNPEKETPGKMVKGKWQPGIFERNMEELATILSQQLGQEKVYVEISKDNVRVVTHKVTPY